MRGSTSFTLSLSTRFEELAIFAYQKTPLVTDFQGYHWYHDNLLGNSTVMPGTTGTSILRRKKGFGGGAETWDLLGCKKAKESPSFGSANRFVSSTETCNPPQVEKVRPSEDTEALPSCSLSGASPPSTFTTSSPVSTLSLVAWCCLTATLVFLHFNVIVPWWGKEPQPSLSDYLLWLPVCCFKSVAKICFSVE